MILIHTKKGMETIYVEQDFHTSPEKFWKALTDADEMRQWYFDIPDFELLVGSTFSFYEPGGENNYLHRCTITEIIPYQKFSHTWTHPNETKGITMVTWLLENNEKGIIKLKFSHEGIEQLADAGPAFARENYEAGWNEIIKTSLLKFLENH